MGRRAFRPVVFSEAPHFLTAATARRLLCRSDAKVQLFNNAAIGGILLGKKILRGLIAHKHDTGAHAIHVGA